MTGAKVNNYAIGDSDIEAVMLTTDQIYKGQCQVTLTEMSTTTVPKIAAGSWIENNGTLFKFDSDETLTGSPSDGIVYIRIVPSTTTCTAEMTNTAPTWSDSKQGWYGTSTYANYRYVGGIKIKQSSLYYGKFLYRGKELYRPSFIYTESIADEFSGNFVTASKVTPYFTEINLEYGDKFFWKLSMESKIDTGGYLALNSRMHRNFSSSLLYPYSLFYSTAIYGNYTYYVDALTATTYTSVILQGHENVVDNDTNISNGLLITTYEGKTGYIRNRVFTAYFETIII